jgi:hypothetical protein
MDSQIKNILNRYSQGDELEIRVGFFADNYKFYSSISSFMFQYLLKQFYGEKSTYNILRQVQTVYMHKSNDPSIRVKTIVTDDEIVTVYKKIKHVEDFHRLGLRLSLGSEEIITEHNLLKINSKDRIRTTFTNKNNLYKIDMTLDKQNKKSFYQMEIEFISPPTFSEVKGILNWVFSIREKLYYYQRIVKEFNSKFTDDKRYRVYDKDIPYDAGAMPKNLKPFTVPFLNNYVITSKPNGISYFLYFSYIYGIYYINKTAMYKASDNPTPKEFDGTIILGEFVNKPDSGYKFYAFDLITYRNNKNIRMIDRHKILNYIKNFLKWNNLEVIPMFYSGNIHDDIKAVFNYIENEWSQETNDGIILKPENLPFNNPFVYKWKPMMHITIDLSVKKKGDEFFGYAYAEDELVLFTGSEKYPYSGKVNMENFKDVSEYSIFEFSYNPNTEILFASRLREDKIKPNFIGVAVSIWEDLKNPFTKAQLIELSKNIILKNDSLVDIAKKVCIYLHLTKDPIIFKELREYINSNLISQIFRGAATFGAKKSMGNELVPIINEYFSNSKN